MSAVEYTPGTHPPDYDQVDDESLTFSVRERTNLESLESQAPTAYKKVTGLDGGVRNEWTVRVWRSTELNSLRRG